MNPRLIVLPAFEVIGLKTYISGPDNEKFSKFWEQCRTDGRLQTVQHIQLASGQPAVPENKEAVLGISHVEADPARHDFDYMIAVEMPDGGLPVELTCDGFNRYTVPANLWAVFECDGEMPGALVASEMYALRSGCRSMGYYKSGQRQKSVISAT